jgi:hypothetical protein
MSAQITPLTKAGHPSHVAGEMLSISTSNDVPGRRTERRRRS